MSILGGIVGALGDISSSLTGGLVNHYFGKKAAKQSYGYAMSMSNSAHQREVKDLEAAGLNPVLSAMGNGAATVAVPVSPGGVTGGNQISTALNSAVSRKLQQEQIDLAEEQTNTQKATTDKTEADAEKAKAEADFLREMASNPNRPSPFENKYYNDPISKFFQGVDNFGGRLLNFFEAGADGGRNSAKSIKFDEHREREYYENKKRSEEFRKKVIRDAEGKSDSTIIRFIGGKPYMKNIDGIWIPAEGI